MAAAPPPSATATLLRHRVQPLLRWIWKWSFYKASVLLPSLVLTYFLSRWRRRLAQRRLLSGSLESMVICYMLSGSSIEKGKVDKRTIFERALSNVYQDVALAEVVARAINQAELEERGDFSFAVLPVPDPYRWMVYNATLNQISATFAPWYIWMDSGLPVLRVAYIFALCVLCESGRGRYFLCAGQRHHLPESLDHGSKRLKAIMVKEGTIRALISGELRRPGEFLSERHRLRWELLEHLAALYQHRKEEDIFMHFEVPVPGLAEGDLLSEVQSPQSPPIPVPHVMSWDPRKRLPG